MSSMTYWIVKTIASFLRWIPLIFALMIGKLIGLIVYVVDRKRRSRVYRHLKKVDPQLNPHKRHRLVREVFKNYGQLLVELFRLPALDRKSFDKQVTVLGREHIDNALKLNKGLILMTIHFGSWELASYACGLLGYPYKVVVKQQAKDERLNQLLDTFRSSGGTITLERGGSTREIFRALDRNEIVGMVIDQGSRLGVRVPFFGQTASFPDGALRIALKRDVPVIFVTSRRIEGGRHEITVNPPLDLLRDNDQRNNISKNLTKIVHHAQELIKSHPEDYLWFYKVWKYSDERKVIILNDGRTGHLRQSEALLQIFKGSAAKESLSVSAKVVDVVFRGRKSAFLCSLTIRLLMPFWGVGWLPVLKPFLTKDSYHQISSTVGDVIISCGSKIAPINFCLSRELDAKNAAIQKTGFIPFKCFNALVLPEHDRKSHVDFNDQVLFTPVAPNLIDEDYLRDQEEQLLNHFSHLKNNLKFKISLFIGGTGTAAFLQTRQIKILINQIKSVLKEIKADILITTSRRTSSSVEKLVVKEFKKDNHCPLLITPNEVEVPEAVGGMLSLADLVLVSGDSISMISEAVSSGKPTIVFSPTYLPKLGGKTPKHKSFIERLAEQGYIVSSDVNHIGQSIYDVVKGKTHRRVLDEHDELAHHLTRLI